MTNGRCHRGTRIVARGYLVEFAETAPVRQAPRLALLCLCLATVPAAGLPFPLPDGPALPGDLNRLNRKLCGRVLDYTHNHGGDHRLYSPSLCAKRNMYIYLPPGYDSCQQWPIMMYLHGLGQNERSLLDLVPTIDSAMREGRMPRMIIAAPDGSLEDRTCFVNGSFYINSKAGRYEDYIIHDAWEFVSGHFPVRPERDAHILAGSSMGGFGAYNLGFKHREKFGVIAGLLPPLNIRYVDSHGHSFGDFDPDCWGFRENLRPNGPVARFYGVIVIRRKRLTDPLFGRGPDAIAALAAENPLEMLETYNIKPGEQKFFIGYSGRDEFNIDAQVQSFLQVAAKRGICPTVNYAPNGRHRVSDTLKYHFDPLCAWLSEVVGPYQPGVR
jgi:S-formylglutathione hydrolase FrmB